MGFSPSLAAPVSNWMSPLHAFSWLAKGGCCQAPTGSTPLLSQSVCAKVRQHGRLRHPPRSYIRCQPGGRGINYDTRRGVEHVQRCSAAFR